MPVTDEIVFAAPEWERLQEHLLRGQGATDEQLAFVLVSANERDGGLRMLARAVIPAAAEDLVAQSPHGISPGPEFVARALTECRRDGWSLLEVHSHPFDSGDSTTFSGIDWSNDRTKMPSLAASMPDGFRHATMVLGRRAVDAHVYRPDTEEIVPVARVTVVGGTADRPGTLCHVPTSSAATRSSSGTAVPDEDRYLRHDAVVGRAGQVALRGATVAVVGLGGLGSFVATQLAHLGVGRLVLIDPDRIETTNLNRLLGAGPDDVGTPKVDFFAATVRRVNPDVDVVTVGTELLDPRALRAVSDADLVVGCVDGHGARLTLNHVAVRYLVPLLDAGTGLERRPDRLHIGGQVQAVVPGLGCLECRGVIDPRRAAFDLATPEMQAYERSHGYGSDDPAPSVVFLNGVVGSLLVAEAVRVLAGTGTGTEPRMLFYDGVAQTVRTGRVAVEGDCPTCGTDGRWAVGDLAPPVRPLSAEPAARPIPEEMVGGRAVPTE